MIPISTVLDNVHEFARGAIGLSMREGTRPGPGGEFTNAYSDEGSIPVRRSRTRAYQEALREASILIKRALDGNSYARLMLRDAMTGRFAFREAMSTSDFPNLFGDIIDRAVLANYRETPYTWNMIAKAAEVSDFRLVKRFRTDFGTGTLDEVEMGGPYQERKISDKGVTLGTYNSSGYYAYNVTKHGARMPFFWETMINDDLQALRDTPARFGRAARRSEEKFVTSLFANNTTFFNSTNFKNTVIPVGPYTGTNPALSISALAQAMTLLSMQKDPDGEPIAIESVCLCVPPALKVTAQNILNADYFWANEEGGTILTPSSGAATSGTRLNVANWARNIVKLCVNYYLPIVDATHGSTGWYLFADPDAGRPALEFGRLRGHVNPELFMKTPNSIAIGEGAMGPGAGPGGGGAMQNPLEGDFDTDAIHYKVRHIYGGTTLDPIMAIYSNGSGS